MNQELIDIVKKVKEKVAEGTDMAWTHYDNPKHLRDDLDSIVQKLKFGDKNSLEDIEMLFLPTASLQEHAICNS